METSCESVSINKKHISSRKTLIVSPGQSPADTMDQREVRVRARVRARPDWFASGLEPTVLNQSSSNLVWTCAMVRAQSLLFLGAFRYPRWPPAAILEKIKTSDFCSKTCFRQFPEKKFLFFFLPTKIFLLWT